MHKRVLILSYGDDFHALAVQALLRRHDADADILDTGAFGTSISLAQQVGSSPEIRLDGKDLRDYRSIWYRRAKAPRPSAEITNQKEAEFAARECGHALWGALYASGLPIYNHPERERQASHKPFQLQAAHDLGLLVPETLFTNSQEAALAFARQHERLIYKCYSPTTWMMMDTRPLTESDLPELWRLQYAPLIFQEYLELGREYRVTMVEDECFVGEIRIADPRAHYDWRLDDNHDILQAELPEDIRTKLQSLRKTLGLNSGSVDLRETPDGRIYFLEINPSGQFLFLDIFADIDVANRFCEMLLQ